MKLSTTTSDLRRVLDKARRAMIDAPSLVAYTALLLEVRDGFLLVTGSDGETTVTAKLKLEDGSEPGSVLLVPDPVLTFLAKLPKGPVTVEVESEGDALVSGVPGPAYRFRQLWATFPPPRMERRNLAPAELDGFDAALACVRHAADGVVQLRSDEHHVKLVATDRYRIADVTLPGAGFGAFSGVLPLSGLDRVAREHIDHIGIDSQGRQLRARGDEVFVQVRLVDEPFPDVSSIVEAAQPHTVSIDRDSCAKALDRLGAIAGTTPIRLQVDGKTLRLHATNIEIGSGTETLDIDGHVQEFSCLVSAVYLREAIMAHPKGSIQLGWSGELQPLHLRSHELMAVRTVVMPVRG